MPLYQNSTDADSFHIHQVWWLGFRDLLDDELGGHVRTVSLQLESDSKRISAIHPKFSSPDLVADLFK